MTQQQDERPAPSTWTTWLNRPVDAAGLAYFRVAFGLSVFWEVCRYLSRDWIADYYLEPTMLFGYWPLEFVRPWPALGMYLHFALLGFASLMLVVGKYTRVASVAVFLGLSFVFLLDKTRYLNHAYLMCLVAFLMIWLPLGKAYALDAKPSSEPPTAPGWTLWLIRFQLGIPYFFGGIAKLSSDWLRGEPMRSWLHNHNDYPLIGWTFEYEPIVQMFTFGGVLFDLLVVPMLLIPRLRVFGLAWMMSFHLLNSGMFKIGVFPWMMMATTLVFLPPSWPRDFANDLIRGGRVRWIVGAFALVGFTIANEIPTQPSAVNALVAVIGMGVLGWEVYRYAPVQRQESARIPASRPAGPVLVAALLLWMGVQCALPLRHLLIPGNANWTEEGHRFAWHMKLRDKRLDRLEVEIRAPDVPVRRVNIRDHLTSHQRKKVGVSPDLLAQFANKLAALEPDPRAGVYVRAEVDLNGRQPQLLVDPEVDLSRVDWPWVPPATWILPLAQPLFSGRKHQD